MAKRKAVKESSATGTRGRTILYTVAALVALAGLADATYLTASALSGETATCGGSTGCFEVLGSAYARIAGIPTAAFGVLGYFSAFTFATFTGFGYARSRTFFSITVWAMFSTTLWLLYLQAFVLHAFCRYCLFSAAITFLLAGLVVASPGEPNER
ncbi:MAG: vitamin K epoxide reductase family protein [Verrucomicrobiota bacterium]|nr:vitamin K epoxide reductase family protein [Verrucomicrobiota bacterium]